MGQGTLDSTQWAYHGQRCAGERVSGDMAWVRAADGCVLVAIFDGLGHGESAHEVAVVAHDALDRGVSLGLSKLFDAVDRALRGTVGGALALARVDPGQKRIQVGGIGNTVVRKVFPTRKSAAASPGVVGQRYKTPMFQELPLMAGDVWLFHTDGISSAFGADEYPQMRYQSARTIARTVVRRFANPFDDATCVALRVES